MFEEGHLTTVMFMSPPPDIPTRPCEQRGQSAMPAARCARDQSVLPRLSGDCSAALLSFPDPTAVVVKHHALWPA